MEMYTEMTPEMVDAMFADPAPAESAAPAETAEVAEPAGETTDAAEEVPAAETEVPETPEEPEAVEEELATAEATEATDPADSDLPEDVRVSEKNGKKEWHFPAEKGKRIYEGHKLAQTAQEVFGQDLTPEVIEARQNAFDWQRTQHLDLISTKPGEQSRAFANMFDSIGRALQNGDIAHDPLETVGEVFGRTLRHYSPDAFGKMSDYIVGDRLANLYNEAHQAGNTRLLRAVQNLDFHLNGKFTKDDDLAKQTPSEIDRREQDIRQREERIQNHERGQAEQRWKAWGESTQAANRDAVKSVISSTIPQALKDAYKNEPERLQRLERLLEIEVKEALRSDQKWRSDLDNHYREARNAPEERRAAKTNEIAKRYEARAKQVMATKAAQILRAETDAAKVASTAATKRLDAAASRKAPAGPGTPAQRQLPGPMKVGDATSESWQNFLNN